MTMKRILLTLIAVNISLEAHYHYELLSFAFGNLTGTSLYLAANAAARGENESHAICFGATAAGMALFSFVTSALVANALAHQINAVLKENLEKKSY